MTKSRTSGLDTVIRNLNKEIQAIEGRTLQGLIKVAAMLRRDMLVTSPTVPKETGNLRASWFATPVKLEKNIPAVTCGFTANYAAYVHEMVGANFTEPGSGAKFFEAALNRNHAQILEIIKAEAKGK